MFSASTRLSFIFENGTGYSERREVGAEAEGAITSVNVSEVRLLPRGHLVQLSDEVQPLFHLRRLRMSYKNRFAINAERSVQKDETGTGESRNRNSDSISSDSRVGWRSR